MADSLTTEPTSAVLSSALSIGRYIISAFGTWAIAKGWLDQSTLNALIALIAAAAPPAYAAWRAYWNARALKAAAPRVPDTIIASKGS